MTALDLASLRAAAEGATPGPWWNYSPVVLDHMERSTDDPAALMEIRRLRAALDGADS